MKKHLYLLLPLLTLTPSMAMWSWFSQQTIKSTIIASTLVLSHKRYNQTLSLDLHQAVEQNNTTKAKQLITNPQVDIHAKVDYGKWNKGCTPLMWCAYKGDKWLPIAQALLAHKDINLSSQSIWGFSPLMQCCKTGDDALKIAQALLGHKHIMVNLGDSDGWTPLLQCCKTGDKSLQIAKALLKHKDINVSSQGIWGFSPLLQCCKTGDKSLQIAQALLKRKDINVNLQDRMGWTPLIGCAFTGDKSLQIAQELLKHQHIKVNLQDIGSSTPLDIMICWIKENKEDYTYVQLWNLLVAQGAVLNTHKNDYYSFNPNNFQEPQRSYVYFIKQNPPKNLSSKKHPTPTENNLNTKFMDHEEETKEDE